MIGVLLRHAVLCAALAATSWSAAAAAPAVGTPTPGYFRTQLGDFELTAVSDGTVELPVDKLLLNATPEQIGKALHDHHLPLPTPTAVNAYVVNTGSKLILIDAGAGQLFGPTLGKLTENLKAAGYRPDQVDEIYLTHLHPDHVGGLAQNGERVFPNAVVRAEQTEVDYWLSEDNLRKAGPDDKAFFEGAAASLNPYRAAGKLQPFSGNANLAPGIRAVVTHGHTKGHSIYFVESRSKTLVIWGDLIHVAAVQFAHPRVAIRFDSDPRGAVRQRKIAFDAAAAEGYLAAGSHLAFPGLGYVRKARARYEWLPLEFGVRP
jgi:glyoxylase-like metal-dependent hydrolase (beta-lactamase superfamily II)